MCIRDRHYFAVLVGCGATTVNAVGIEETTVAGVTTNKLPQELFVVKFGDDGLRFAESAEKALKKNPEVFTVTSVGIGTSHRFVSTNQNAKVIVALDNVIQSPIVSTALTTTLADQVLSVDNILKFSGITSFFGSDLIKIGDEIMKIMSVGVGSTNAVRVRRGQLGTLIGTGNTGDPITKVVGNYNITDSVIHFAEAPYGQVPIGSTTNPPDERDWEGISASSSFQGRMFMRSGIEDTTDDTYHTNYLFDSLSNKTSLLGGNRKKVISL